MENLPAEVILQICQELENPLDLLAAATLSPRWRSVIFAYLLHRKDDSVYMWWEGQPRPNIAQTSLAFLYPISAKRLYSICSPNTKEVTLGRGVLRQEGNGTRVLKALLRRSPLLEVLLIGWKANLKEARVLLSYPVNQLPPRCLRLLAGASNKATHLLTVHRELFNELLILSGHKLRCFFPVPLTKLKIKPLPLARTVYAQVAGLNVDDYEMFSSAETLDMSLEDPTVLDLSRVQCPNLVSLSVEPPQVGQFCIIGIMPRLNSITLKYTLLRISCRVDWPPDDSWTL